MTIRAKSGPRLNGVRHGFTLLEVLIAFAIAAMAILLLYQGAGESLTSVRTAGRYAEAVSRAQSHLAALGWVLSAMPAESNGDDGGGFEYQLSINPVLQHDVPRGAPAPQKGISTLYAVKVRMSWREGGHERHFSLDSLRLGPPSSEIVPP